MKFRAIFAAALTASLLSLSHVATAADQDRDRDQDRDKTQDQDKTQDRDQTRDKTQDKDKQQVRITDRIYGYNLMTAAEREEYRNKMRTMKTAEEREAFRLEHHKRMQERAKEKGITLPDEPPVRGQGMHPGGGMGPGGGMRPGR